MHLCLKTTPFCPKFIFQSELLYFDSKFVNRIKLGMRGIKQSSDALRDIYFFIVLISRQFHYSGVSITLRMTHVFTT